MAESFNDELAAWPRDAVIERLARASARNASAALAAVEAGNALSPEAYLALLSPAAAPFLERMAAASHSLTLRQFGRAVQLFTPLYLANYCTNHCVYCGFNTRNPIERRRLTMDEIEREGEAIAATGLRHILLLTGDAPRLTGPAYIAEAVRRLRRFFPGIGVEVQALAVEEYALLRETGVDSMTMFQETYNASLYATFHPAGPKRDFHFRLDAPDRAGQAGMRSLNVGALLGLDDWRADSFFTALHARWLQRRHPGAEIGLSVPRMRPHAGSPVPVHPVSDRDLVQLITAARLFLPAVGITVSSRERPAFRDRLIQLGVTRVSAGVSTAVGGHASGSVTSSATPAVTGEDQTATGAGSEAYEDTPQFEIADARSVPAMEKAIAAQGFQPVLKYWEPLEGASFACGGPEIRP